MVHIEEVELHHLEHGDQIAIMGDVAELNPTLKNLMFIIEGSDTYFHHGIYDKEKMEVIELQGETKQNAVPKRRTIRQFLAGRTQLYRVVHEKCLPVEETMKMAEDILDKKESWPGYGLIVNNCETFATYLKTGERRSQQVLEAIKQFLKFVIRKVVPAAAVSSAAVGGSIGAVGGSGSR